MSIVSHNTDAMRSWSQNMDTNASDYDSLINRLYNLIEGFAGSERFKGGLSTDFLNQILELKPQFLKYSSTFRECSELITSRAQSIELDEAALQSSIKKSNPLNY